MVMGNHEFNAIAFAARDPEHPERFLRPHTPKNLKQHRAFREQSSEEQQGYYLAWFRTLPLWLDLGGLRVVHACWHQPSIDRIERILGGSRLQSFAQLAKAAKKSSSPTSLYEAVEVVLKGPELSLPSYGASPFRDKDQHERAEARVRWWKPGATTLKELAEVPNDDVLPNVRVRARDRSFSYNETVPVVYGHYWRTIEHEQHEISTEQTACVDFSAVRGGALTAYRWSGESTIDPKNFRPKRSKAQK